MISPGFGNLMSCSLVRCACIALDCQCTQPCVPTVQSLGLSLGTYFDNVHHRSHLSSVSSSPVLVASFWATPKCTLFTYSHIFHFFIFGQSVHFSTIQKVNKSCCQACFASLWTNRLRLWLLFNVKQKMNKMVTTLIDSLLNLISVIVQISWCELRRWKMMSFGTLLAQLIADLSLF